MSAGLHTVHVRVNDAATGQPTPVRIRITDSEGTYYAPFGRLTDFATKENEDVGGNLLLGSKEYAYVDGTCEISLPPGVIHVELHKGPEYTPRQFEDKLGAGQLALRYTMERWTNLREERWYSGDTRAYFLTPHGALLEAAAEDLAVVNLLITGDCVGTFPVITNILAFSGQRPALERPGHLVAVNTLNYHAVLGSLSLLNCHRIVYPLEVHEDEDLGRWTLADWCDQCHRKAGLVVWDGNSPRSLIDLPYGEGLADLVLGKVDAVESTPVEAVPRDLDEYWYPLLDCGGRVPLVGCGGKWSNCDLLGGRRTYARLHEGEDFNYHNWIEAVRAGRTFVTNGPLLNFTVNGQGPGAVLSLPAAGQPVQIAAEARGTVPFDRLELLLNGNVIAVAAASGSPAAATMNIEMVLPSAGWLAVRCHGAHQVCVGRHEEPVTAHSSPVYVQVDGQPAYANRARVDELLVCLDGWITQIARLRHSGNGQATHRLMKIFESARQVLQERIHK